MIRLMLLTGLVVLLSACVTTRSIEEKRAAVQEMKAGVLADLYQEKPDVRSQIASAAGYGVFSNASVNVILASFGGGYGVVRNNASGQDIYMKMGEVGVGLGAGVKDFRAVFVFHSRDALNRFVDHGWTFGGQADAAAKAGNKGGAIGGEAILDNVTIYQLTESGLALQAMVKGTKFWRDDELNESWDSNNP